MDNMNYFLNKLIEYSFTNRLTVDKGTYFEVVFGLIAFFGILLTFYQFAASIQGNSRYLGYNTLEYYIKNTFSNRIVSNKLFIIILLFEILYKPFISIYGSMLYEPGLKVANFFWFFFAVLYIVFVIVLLFNFKKSIQYIKYYSNNKNDSYLIEGINRIFLRKTVKERLFQRPIDLLARDLDSFRRVIANDSPEFQIEYNSLIKTMFTDYINQKEKDILKCARTGKFVRNQICWKYNEAVELHLIQGLISGRYVQVDGDLLRFILRIHVDILKLNFIIAKLDGCIDLSFYRFSFYIDEKNTMLANGKS